MEAIGAKLPFLFVIIDHVFFVSDFIGGSKG
jgi:hypothetical protein